MDYRNIGAKIKRLRKKRELTQECLAELADINVTYLGKIERGESSPTIDILHKIAKAFNISLIDLLYFESENISELVKNKRIYDITLEFVNTVKKILDE